MTLTPEERQRIYEEEKAGLAQVTPEILTNRSSNTYLIAILAFILGALFVVVITKLNNGQRTSFVDFLLLYLFTAPLLLLGLAQSPITTNMILILGVCPLVVASSRHGDKMLWYFLTLPCRGDRVG